MYDYKIYAPVTTWPQERFISPKANLSAACIVKQTSQRFSNVSPKEKIMAIFQI